MNIEDLLRCVHLLVFEDETYGEYPYFIGGTGFIVRFSGKYWLITAKHCLENQKVRAEQISIVPHQYSRDFLPFEVMHYPTTSNVDDSDYTDFIILKIKTELLNQDDMNSLSFFDLSNESLLIPGNYPETTFLARGFPKDINHVDYDRRTLPRTSFTFEPSYREPDTADHCHVFSCPSHPQISSLDGLSGSPIFSMTRTGYRYLPRLSAMAIRGGNGIIRAIGADILLRAFKEVSA